MNKLIIFHHMPKAAGSSLLYAVRKNYSKKEMIELYGPDRDSVEWYREYYRSIPAERRNAIRCIAAHTSHYIIPVLDRPFHAFCMLRNPVDRVLSLYYYAKKVAKSDPGRAGKIGQMINKLNWNVEDIYLKLGNGGESSSELHELFKYFFNGQVRMLLSPYERTMGFMFSEDDEITRNLYAEKVTSILNKHYTVGIQECFEKSLQLFVDTFGWKKIKPKKKNVNKKRPKLESVSNNIISLILSYNLIDFQIHQQIYDRLCE